MKTQTNLQPPNIALPQAPGHSIEVLVRHHPHVGVLVVQQSEEHLHGHGEGDPRAPLPVLASPQPCTGCIAFRWRSWRWRMDIITIRALPPFADERVQRSCPLTVGPNLHVGRWTL